MAWEQNYIHMQKKRENLDLNLTAHSKANKQKNLTVNLTLVCKMSNC